MLILCCALLFRSELWIFSEFFMFGVVAASLNLLKEAICIPFLIA